MKFFRFFKNELKLDDIEKEPKKRHHLSFHETYRFVTIAMVFGVMYPNPKNEKLRITLLMCIYGTIGPVSFMILKDTWHLLMQRELVEVIRHLTVLVPFLIALVKMFLMYMNRVNAKILIDEIDADHELFNQLPESYRDMVDQHFRDTLFAERCWTGIVISCVMVFPLMGALLTLFSHVTKSEPTRYMIHDMPIPFTEPDFRFTSPCYEIMFAYQYYCSLIYALNYVGYDGFYGIVINHACFKMQLYCKALKDTMENNEDVEVIRHDVAEVIKAQVRVFEIVEIIQSTFNFWLGLILGGALIHVCCCTYQITEGYGMDLKYLIFITGSVIHIFLPCRYGTKLSSSSVETATLFYCCGWERVCDQRVRKMLAFMIARAQIPLVITAFNMMTFDMDLFSSIMHTSYSMFTLLRE